MLFLLYYIASATFSADWKREHPLMLEGLKEPSPTFSPAWTMGMKEEDEQEEDLKEDPGPEEVGAIHFAFSTDVDEVATSAPELPLEVDVPFENSASSFIELPNFQEMALTSVRDTAVSFASLLQLPSDTWGRCFRDLFIIALVVLVLLRGISQLEISRPKNDEQEGADEKIAIGLSDEKSSATPAEIASTPESQLVVEKKA